MVIFPYVAVVRDTDGSAFITKAEFDSLKNNFQAQIDNYNQSIDSKIDGAIASYLAGIKVNTDDTPEYSVYGARYGSAPYIWDGRVANVQYIVSVGSNCFTSSQPRFWLNLTSSTRTNRGYGYGYWAQGYRSGSSYFESTGNKALLIDNFAQTPAKGSTTTGYDGFKYKVNYTGSASFDGTLGWTLPGYDWTADVCSCAVSDLFYTKISIVYAQFPLYEFYDSGEVTIYFARCKDGYAYEAGAQGGQAGEPPWQTNTSSKSKTTSEGSRCVLMKDHNGSVTTIKDILTTSDKAWIAYTVDVQPGDRILLDCRGNWSSGGSGRYCIFWFSHDIPGWKIRST